MKEKDGISLLDQWKAKQEKPKTPSISKVEGTGPFSLSHGQNRLWLLQQLNPNNPFYNYSEAYILKGHLDIASLQGALQLIYESHDILRTVYQVKNDLPVAVVKQAVTLQPAIHDISKEVNSYEKERIDELLLADATKPFDLENGPLLRCSVYKLQNDYHILLLGLHHIAIDQWSMGILREQLATCYTWLFNGKLPTLKRSEIQYQDYAYWQLKNTLSQESMDYWKDKLSGDIPVLDLPNDFLPPSKPSYKGAFNTRRYSMDLSNGILQLASKLNCTPYVLLLSVYYVLLHRYSGQKDIAIGSPVSVRDQKVLENLIGFFLNTIVLRTRVENGRSFTQLVDTVKRTTLDAFSHKQVPFEELVKLLRPERGSNSNPFFNVMFLYNSSLKKPDFGPKLEFEEANFDMDVSKFDLTLHMSQEDGMLKSMFEYSTDIFKPETIDRLQEHFLLLLKGIVENPNREISEIPMLLDFEKDLFFNYKGLKNVEGSSHAGIHEIIDKTAKAFAESTAVTYGDQSITYSEMSARADNLAHKILETTHGKNRVVGLLVERSVEMMVGLLSILKAGCAYMPLDSEYPEERLKFMLDDADVPLIISDAKNLISLDGVEAKILDLTDERTLVSSRRLSLPKVNPADMAYIIYTSGSTGKPKGVAISHANIINSTRGRTDFYGRNPHAFLLMSSISFDSSKAGIFWTLCTGGNLVISENRLEQDVEKLVQTIYDNKITHTLMLPSLYRVLLEHADTPQLKTLDTVIVAGEACSNALCAKHFELLPCTSLYNEYGPTEATVWCIAHKIEKHDLENTIPIGKPVANAQIYLLNEVMHLVPFGATGEIFIGGPGLSGRYWGRDELTRQVYLDNPFDRGADTKLYKTGDLGRYNSKGQIEFLGRADSQIKLRGFRIELEEIEQVILDDQNVQEVAVMIVDVPNKNDSNSTKLLVAFITGNDTFDQTQLLRHLKEHLPKHMVPNKVVRLEQFAKLPNGKIDKKELQNLSMVNFADKDRTDEPQSETEKKIIKIWESVLGFGGLGANDNFFEIGGDSIMTIQIIAKARKMGMAISPNQIFEYQTAAELASFVDDNRQKVDQWDYLVALRKQGAKAPLFCIHAGGGHVFFYNGLTDHLNSEIPIYALQPSGLYGNKKMHQGVAEMAYDYLKAIRKLQPKGPYNILVYCFSAAVGNEMALLLEQAGEEINLIVVDTMTAPAVLNTPRRLRIRILSFLARLLRSPYSTLKGMAIAKYSIWRMRWRSNFETEKDTKDLEKLRLNLMKLSQSYEWKSYKGKTSLILTDKDHESLNRETVRSWRAIARNEVQILRTAGSHRLLFEEPYIKQTAKSIEKCMMQ